MMKKVIFYTLAVVGLYSVLFFSYQLVVPRVGMTMYGGAQTAYRAPDASGSIPTDEAAMKAGNISLVPSEPTMKRMIIRNARITLQVNDLSRTIDDITKITEKSNGYVVYSDFNDPLYGGRYAEMSIRIPANGLNSMMNALKGLAVRVVQESVTGEDITEQYVNLESELNNLQATKTQLTKIMQGATKTPDVLQVFQQLSETQKKIDVLEGKIKYFKESVAYSLITISLNMNPAILTAKDSSWNISQVVAESYHSLINGVRQFTYGIIQFAIFFLPMILLWGLCVLILFLIGRRIYLRFK